MSVRAVVYTILSVSLVLAAMITVATWRIRQDVDFAAAQIIQKNHQEISTIVDLNVLLLQKIQEREAALEQDKIKTDREKIQIKSAVVALAKENAKLSQENEELSDYIRDKLGKVDF